MLAGSRKKQHDYDDHDTLKRKGRGFLSSIPPEKDGFSDEEVITKNLRFRSLPAAQRTILGLFVFIPPKWRGPVAIVAILVIAILLYKLPGFVSWLRGL